MDKTESKGIEGKLDVSNRIKNDKIKSGVYDGFIVHGEITFGDVGLKWPIIRNWTLSNAICTVFGYVPMSMITWFVGDTLYKIYENTDDLTLPILGGIYMGIGWFRMLYPYPRLR